MSTAAAIAPERLGRDAARGRVDELQKGLAHVHEERTRNAAARSAADILVTQLLAKISQLENRLRLRPADQGACSEGPVASANEGGISAQIAQPVNAAASTPAHLLSRDAARARVIELEKEVSQANEELAREAVARKASDDRTAKLQTRMAHLETLMRLGPEERVAYLDNRLTASEKMREQNDALLKSVQNRCACLEDLLKVATEDNAILIYKLEEQRRDKHEPSSEQLTPARRKKYGIPEKPGKDPAPEQSKPPSDQASDSSSDKEPENKPAKTKRKRPPNSGGRRPRKPGPMRVQVVDVPEAERVGKIWLRNDISIKEGYEPAQRYLLKIIHPIYVDPNKIEPPLSAPLPPQVIPKSNVLTDMVVRILRGKYMDKEPLYRQEEIDKRAGIVITRAARCRYVEESAHLLLPIYEALEQRVILSFYIVMDETVFKTLDPKRPGAAQTAWLWGFYAPYEDVVVMRFSTSRGAKVVLDFLPPDWPGVAHTDGYSGYTSAFSQLPRVVHVECCNHLRRYVLKAVKAGHKEAISLLAQIETLYKIEAEAREQELTPYAREQLRQAKARPVLESLKDEFLKLQQRKEPLMGRLKEAVTYATSRWDHLALYAEPGYGYVEIDQTAIERIWRPEKVGLKNFLFVGHPDAGWRSAVIYSIIETCKMVGVDPEEYLLWALPKLAARPRTGPAAPRAKGLLPHDFKKFKEQQVANVRPRPAPPQHPDDPFCSARPFPGHRRYRKAHRTRDGSALAA
jgi:transposase